MRVASIALAAYFVSSADRTFHEHHTIVVALKRRVQGTHQLLGALPFDGRCTTDDDPVRPHEVIERRTLFQELRIRDNRKSQHLIAFFELFCDRCIDPVCGAHRHRRLIYNHLHAGHVLADIARSTDDILKVGRAIFVRRSADRDEQHFAVLDCSSDVGRKGNPSSLLVPSHHFKQTRLVNRDRATIEDGDLAGVYIKAQHLIADFGHARTRNQADVTTTNDCYFHSDCCKSSSSLRSGGYDSQVEQPGHCQWNWRALKPQLPQVYRPIRRV